MRHGFKAHAERLAKSARAELGLGTIEKLDPKKFLTHKGFVVWTPQEVPSLPEEVIEQLTINDPDAWSGLTIREPNCTAIIYNPTHSSERTANTLMHEWAHLELRHKPNRVDRSDQGILLLSDYPAELEEEADLLAATALIPRDGILHHRRLGLDVPELALHFGTSQQLAKWRLRTTGVDRQLASRRR